MGRNIFSPSVFTSRQNNTMKLAVVFIVLTAFALAQAKKCNLKGGQCVEFYTGMIVGPTGPQLPKPDCQKCRADAVARSVTEPKCFIPACKPKKPNEFMRYQYDPNAGTGKGAKKGQSFRYTIYGVEIKGTRVDGKGANCKVKPAYCKKAERNTDRPGNDIKRVKAPNFQACKKLCLQTPGCVAVTYRARTKDCWLKNKVGTPRRVRGLTSTTCPVDPKPAPPKLNPCAMKKIKLAKKGNPFNIRPDCDKKGNYKPVQCWKQGTKVGSEWCWCSQKSGRIIPGTFYKKSTKSRKPNCRRHINIKPKCKKGDVLIPYPGNFAADCGRYISCSPDRVFTCICGAGQHFDFKNQRCDWAKDVKCNKKN